MTRDLFDLARGGAGYRQRIDRYRILHDFALDLTSRKYKGPPNTVSHTRALADLRGASTRSARGRSNSA